MPLRNIVVVVVDRLGPGWLGPYGNAWIPTPTLNRLAAQSLLCEFAISDSCELAQVYRSYFSGVPAWRTIASSHAPLAQLARDAGYQTALITDAEEVARHPLASAFEQADLLTWQRIAATVQQVSQTRLGDVFTTAAEAISKATEPTFLWIHAAGPNAAWDAPRELRERMTAEDDPPPQEFVEPPSLLLEKNYDPDSLLGFVQAYAAELVACDENLGTLLTTLESVFDPSRTLLVFTSPRGYALGEHMRVGVAGDSLRGELLHVPLLIRSPDAASKLTRHGGLHQPIDLYALIRATMQSDRTSDVTDVDHAFVASSAPGELSLRTTHWFYRRSRGGDDEVQELYAKPDDRWEVNEVSQRAAEVVEAFGDLVHWLEAHRTLPEPPAFPELPEIIAQPPR
jgi:arylsulfatase A-like enzyme